ncbi:hypothetical protein [Actinomadura rupiterrae]|uniref:hypothetical protein n=1 Tax=Actinomadura rupiterrae TaxID=559627 RepID=UPI0020A26146|nr:hypothetical protein [Actinomadura rupiterrae]MCP2336695.1 putative flavoprotein YhiN [Actinomadura rupiterrae]
MKMRVLGTAAAFALALGGAAAPARAAVPAGCDYGKVREHTVAEGVAGLTPAAQAKIVKTPFYKRYKAVKVKNLPLKIQKQIQAACGTVK